MSHAEPPPERRVWSASWPTPGPSASPPPRSIERTHPRRPSPGAGGRSSAWPPARRPSLSTPIWSHRHRAGALSFRDVTTYNLDEYYPISPVDPRSYRSYMHRHLFGRVDLAPEPHPRARRHRARGVRRRARRAVRALDRGRRRPRPPAPGDRPQRPHRLQRAVRPARRRGPGACRPGSSSSTRSPAPTPPASSARRDAVIPRALTMGIGNDPGRALDRDPRHRRTQGRPSPARCRGPMTASVPGSLLQAVAPRGHLDPRRGRGVRARAGSLTRSPDAVIISRVVIRIDIRERSIAESPTCPSGFPPQIGRRRESGADRSGPFVCV